VVPELFFTWKMIQNGGQKCCKIQAFYEKGLCLLQSLLGHRIIESQNCSQSRVTLKNTGIIRLLHVVIKG